MQAAAERAAMALEAEVCAVVQGDRVTASVGFPAGRLPAHADLQAETAMRERSDRFKQVNDTLGHAAGDRLLMIAADRIRAELRGSDLAGRFGGGEFAVLLRGTSEVADALALGERLVRSLSEPVLIGGRRVSVGASVGIARSGAGDDPAELMRRADIAMYQAKRNGRDCCEVFTGAHLLDFAAS